MRATARLGGRRVMLHGVSPTSAEALDYACCTSPPPGEGAAADLSGAIRTCGNIGALKSPYALPATAGRAFRGRTSNTKRQ